MNPGNSAPIKVAVAGLGQLGGGVAGRLANLPQVELVAGADPREGAQSAFRVKYEGRAYPTIEALCADPEVKAVYVCTPSALHCESVITLAEHGKHIVITKPMAMTLDECDRMIEAVEKNKVVLVYGMSGMPFQPSFIGMRQIIESGRLGRLRALTHWAFSDWMLRPRDPHEVIEDGGLLFNQGVHPVDALRLVGGGMVRSVRGATLDFPLENRPTAGYVTGFLEFEDGTVATMLYDGYGYIYGWEFTPWAEPSGRLAALEDSYAFRRQLRAGTSDEEREKERSRFGGRSDDETDFRDRRRAGGAEGWVPGDDGMVIAHCERGAIRQSPSGLYVYDDEGRHDEPVPAAAGVDYPTNEIDELVNGIAGRPVLRDGRWGKATLEVALALAESGTARKELLLKHQVPVPPGQIG